MRKPKYQTLRSGIATFLLGSIGVCTSLIFRTPLIIEAGIGVANAVQLAGWAVTATGGVVALAGTVPALKDVTRSMSEGKRTGALAAGNDPAVIRRELKHQKEHHPPLAADIDRCIAQIDNVEKQRNQFAEVLRLSAATESWGDIISLLADTENTILENFKKVILFGISYEDETPQAQQEYRALIEEQLGKNQALLDKYAETRKHVTSLIAGTTQCSSAELEAYLSVLRGMVAQNIQEK